MRPFRTPAIEFIPDTNESMVDVDIHWESQSVAMQESQVRDPEQQHQQKKTPEMLLRLTDSRWSPSKVFYWFTAGSLVCGAAALSDTPTEPKWEADSQAPTRPAWDNELISTWKDFYRVFPSLYRR